MEEESSIPQRAPIFHQIMCRVTICEKGKSTFFCITKHNVYFIIQWTSFFMKFFASQKKAIASLKPGTSTGRVAFHKSTYCSSWIMYWWSRVCPTPVLKRYSTWIDLSTNNSSPSIDVAHFMNIVIAVAISNLVIVLPAFQGGDCKG